MEKKSLSKQTADRLYTTIVVEQQLQPGEKLPNELELAQQLGTIRVASIILLGALVKKLGLEQYDWTALIRRKVPAKFLEANLKAYQVGLQSV